MFTFALFILIVVALSLVFYKPIKSAFNEEFRQRDDEGNVELTTRTHPAHTGVNVARGVFTLIALLLVGFSAWTVVPSQHFAVVQQFGNDEGTLSEGWTFVPPWQDVFEFDGRVQAVEYTGDQAIDGRAGDDATYDADIAVRYFIPDQASAQAVFDEYRDLGNFERNAVLNDTRGTIRSSFDDYDVLDLDSRRAELQSNICAALTEGWQNVGVRCVEVDIRQIRIDADVEAAAEAVNTARLRRDQAVFDVQSAEELAQVEVIEAQAAFDAQQIFECGYSEEIDDNGNRIVIPNTRDDDGGGCDDVLSDRGLYVRCLAGRTGAVEGAQTNSFIVPPDCESLLTGESSNNDLAGAELLIRPN